jgi:hypothetical protein
MRANSSPVMGRPFIGTFLVFFLPRIFGNFGPFGRSPWEIPQLSAALSVDG